MIRSVAASLLICAVASLPGCGKEEAAAKTPPKPPPAPVMVAMTTQRDVPIRIQTIATAQPTIIVMLKPQVNGYIAEKLFKVGPVAKGQVMYKLDARPYEAALQHAQAALARDEARVVQDQALARNARDEANRKVELAKQGAATDFEADRAVKAAEAAEALVAADKATVAADKAMIEQARLDIEHCTITSPIDGITGPTLTDFGNVVKENDTQLIQLRQIDPIYIELIVPQRYLTPIRQAMAKGDVPMEISIPESSQPPFSGTLFFVNSAVNEDTGTITVRGIVPNEDKKLWPGQYLHGALTIGMRKGAILLPATAVQNSQSGTYVYIVKPDKTVEMRHIKVAAQVGDQAVVEEGLEPHLMVITEGHLRVVPGAAVDVKNSPQGAQP